MLAHRGYVGHVFFDENTQMFCGEVIHTQDRITFQAANLDDLDVAFARSIRRYTLACYKRGVMPERGLL